ncbi:endothelin-converting enzyme homolog [Centruroides vittatus]|uniref:endothelin-converting enzyme homolog n=1 Tax=Centruroides vittatus TaxID=120091 RepID=UPI00350ED568
MIMESKLKPSNVDYDWKNAEMKVEKHYFLISRFLGVSNTWTGKKIVTVIIILVLLFASALIALIIIVSYRPEKNEVCRSISCLEAALDLKRGINESVDPCEDFYTFACGKYTNANRNDKISEIRSDFIKNLKDIIDDAWIIPNLPNPLKQFFIVYNSYTSYQYVKEKDLEWIKILIYKLGGCSIIDENWREYIYNWEESYAKAMKMGAHTPIFSISVNPDRRNTKRNIITIMRTFLTPENNEKNRALRTTYLPFLADLTQENFEELLKEIDEIDKELLLDESAASDVMMDEKETEFMTIEKLEEFIPEVNWERLIQIIFEDIHLPTKLKVTSNTEILLVGKTFLSKFIKKIYKRIISKRQLANYLCVTLTEKFADTILISNETGKVISSTINLMEKLSSSFGYALDYLYYHHKKTQLQKINFTSEITDHIKEFMSHSLSNKSWLDAETKRVIDDKIKKMIITTRFPEFIENTDTFIQYYKDLPIMTSNPYENIINLEKFHYRKILETLSKHNNREAWETDTYSRISATGISPRYVSHQNKVVITQFFQLDFMLNVNYPAYVNFARYGFILAHEIVHSLDRREVTRSSIGNVMNLWSENSNKEYIERMQCLINQYGSYEILSAVKINGKKTINENMADNGGLRHAYLAYKEYINNNKTSNTHTLIGFENYTPEQMFFISYASLFCDASLDEELKYKVNTDEHCPNKFRVLGPLSNTKEFSEAFKCDSNKPMNLANKCVLW